MMPMNNRAAKAIDEEYAKEERMDAIKTEKMIAWFEKFAKENKYSWPENKRRNNIAQRVLSSLCQRDTLAEEDRICSILWKYIERNYSMEHRLDIVNSCISGLVFCCPFEKLNLSIVNKILSDKKSDMETVFLLCWLIDRRFSFEKFKATPDIVVLHKLLSDVVDAYSNVLLVDRKHYKFVIRNAAIILCMLSCFGSEFDLKALDKFKNMDHDLSKMFVISNLEREIESLKDKNKDYADHLQNIIGDLS
jgi:hypothetical protein